MLHRELIPDESLHLEVFVLQVWAHIGSSELLKQTSAQKFIVCLKFDGQKEHCPGEEMNSYYQKSDSQQPP